MYGAFLGDMIGAPYEFDMGDKTKDFPLFSKRSQFTDDSVMTAAVAEALLSLTGDESDEEVHEALIYSMQKWGRRFPYAGYGGNFIGWIYEEDPKPYGSCGNGSAMRVSAAGWLYGTMEETRKFARLTAEVTHNHPEGIKGAEATASAIFLARHGASKEEIKNYIISEFNYDLSRTCNEIRPTYRHVELCQQTVPEAITAFLEGENFEDVIRTAVSLGGDCDTLTCIAGSVAEAFYGVPEELKTECRNRLHRDILAVLDEFEEVLEEKAVQAERAAANDSEDPFLVGNEMIADAIAAYCGKNSEENLAAVLEAIRQRMHADGHFIVPVITNENNPGQFAFQKLQSQDGRNWMVSFTSKDEFEKGEPSQVMSNFIDTILEFSKELRDETAGIVINPWGKSFLLTNDLIDSIFAADGGEEYRVPEDEITEELLEDGTYLQRAVKICSKNRTPLNMIKLAKILRYSNVWIPCNQIMSEADRANAEKIVMEALEAGGPDALVGKEFVTKDEVRMIPDILQNGDSLFFPVFAAMEDMGEYGNNFSKVARPFTKAVKLAKNNEKPLEGIVINAFTDPVVIPNELFGLVEEME